MSLHRRAAATALALATAACGGHRTAPASPPAQASSGEPVASAPGAAAADPDPTRDSILWRAKEDLDGDHIPEEVLLTSKFVARPPGQHDDDPRMNVPVTDCDPAGDFCPAVLSTPGAALDLNVPAGYFGGIGLSVIDIDASDGRKELLLVQRGDNDEDPWFEFTILLYDGQWTPVPLWHAGGYNSGTLSVDGQGIVTLLYDECPDTFLVEYRLQNGRLVEVNRKTARTRNPDSCAG